MTSSAQIKTLRLVLGALLAVASFGSAAQTAAIEQRLEKALKDLGFADGKLPALKPAFGNYVDSVRVGNLLFLSSAAPQKPTASSSRAACPTRSAWTRRSWRLSSPARSNRMKLVLATSAREAHRVRQGQGAGAGRFH
jgi:hypothetical protein